MSRLRLSRPGRHTASAAAAETVTMQVRPPGWEALRAAGHRGPAPYIGGQRPSADLLRQIRDGLRDLDAPAAAHIRAFSAAGTRPSQAALRGLPAFAGIAVAEDGRPFAGLNLGRLDGDGDLVLDEYSAERLEALIEAAEAAAAALRRHRPAHPQGGAA